MTHPLKRISLFAVLLGLLSIEFGSSHPAHSYDGTQFCLEQKPILALFIDVTTSFDEKSKSILIEGIEKFARSLQGGERIVLMTIEDSFSKSAKLFDGCVPVCESSGWIDWLFGDCTSGLVRLKRKEMNSAIRSGLSSRLAASTDLPRSDIIRTISENTQIIFSDKKGGTLFIFSDMIENSELIPGKDFWTLTNDELLSRAEKTDLIPALKGVTVKAFGLGRGGDNDRTPLNETMLQKLRQFWTDYFEMAGVTKDHLLLTPTLP